MKIKLQKMTLNDTLRIFHVSVIDNNRNVHKTFLTDTLKSDVFAPLAQTTSVFNTLYNKNSLYADNVVYYNMYESKNIRYKSPFYKVPSSQRTGMTYDFQDVVNHKLSAEITNSTKILNFIYMLEPKSVAGHVKLDIELNCWLSSDTGNSNIPQNTIQTVIYDKEKLITNISAGILDDNAISASLDNVEYNMIYELNGLIYNDYESGNVAAHVFKGKNQYDCQYNMVKSQTALLSNLRDYVDIGSCNNLLYLKYIDNCYVKDKDTIEKNNNRGKYNFTLPSIEIIKNINRIGNNDNHNTTLYSINIDVKHMYDLIKVDKESELSNANVDDIKDNVTNEIQNCVRSISETLLPANTQLFHVFVNGK